MRLFPLLFLLACGTDPVDTVPDDSDVDTDSDTDSDTDTDTDTDGDTDDDRDDTDPDDTDRTDTGGDTDDGDTGGGDTDDTEDTDTGPGEPAPEGADLVGRTWQLDDASVVVTEPPGLDGLLDAYMEGVWFATITSVSGDSLEGLLAAGTEAGAQETCAETPALPALDYSGNPDFTGGPVYRLVSFGGMDVPVHDLIVTGRVSADGSRITRGTAQGLVDTRPLVPLVDETGDDAAICDLAASIGVSCTACPDGTDYCLFMRAEEMVLDEVAVSVVDVTDPLSDASCSEEVSFCSCATTSWTAGTPILVGLAALVRRRRR